MFSWFFYGYVLAGGVVAARLAWYLLVEETHEQRAQIDKAWPTVIVCVFAWPLAAGRFWENPEMLFDTKISVDDLKKELNIERQAPVPQCGATIQYTAIPFGILGGGCGVFTFKSVDVANALQHKVSKNNYSLNDKLLLDWVDQRDEEISESVDVPVHLDQFRFSVPDMIRSGCGKVLCKECNLIFKADALIPPEHGRAGGWCYVRISCPNGHELLKHETIHLSLHRS